MKKINSLFYCFAEQHRIESVVHQHLQMLQVLPNN